MAVDLKKSKNPSVFIILMMFSALSFVVSLAWNSFFEKVAKKYIGDNDSVLGYFIYATTLTTILIISAYLAIRFFPSYMN